MSTPGYGDSGGGPANVDDQILKALGGTKK
jgi:hypothetical protein